MSESPLRQALWPLGMLYGAVAAARNFAFDAGLKRVHALAVPVVSVGNLTVGGTGKTPTVAWLCQLATARGRRPGVLARGYGRAAGDRLNDEGEMLARRFPELLQEQDPDRVAAGRRLVERGADYIVLDDGFQHRRLGRDLDIVCLDAALPFGNGHCLPAGDLREFRSGLRRAGLLLLTRAERLAPDALAARVQRLRRIAGKPELPIRAATHAPAAVTAWPSGDVTPPGALAGVRVALLSAIARPASFRATVETLGAEVVRELRYRDHHRYTDAEARAAVAVAESEGALLLTTEKDDAKLARLAPELPRSALRVDLQFLDTEPAATELLL
ncbi:MAG: tetraacyldisaccharide 4'-kinase [Planctomycetes bacterium]|nr:tetraacyldisaccharide 4'-kinase [Planctomycetota bacterium]